MDPVTCRCCAQSVRVTTLDLPLTFRVDPADAFHPRQFVIIGRSRLLHRCELSEQSDAGSDPVPHSSVVHQAQGMVAVQADCTMDQALALMRDTAAAAAEVTLAELAAAVLDGGVTFDPPTGGNES